MEKFNENLSQFTTIIKTLYPEQKDAIEKYYVFENVGDKYLKEFILKIINFIISKTNK